MNKVLKLQRTGLQTPTVVEYKGKILATNQLSIEGTCNLWRCHFGFYPTEKVDLVMTKKQFSIIQQRTLSSVKSVYELFCEYNFIPRVFKPTEESVEWGMYRNEEIEELKAENATLRERLDKAEHRVEVAERALLTACVNLVKDEEDNVNMELLARVVYTNYLRKAEKELAEEKKDAN